MSPPAVGGVEVGRHVPIPATSEEAQAAASRAQTRVVRAIAGVTLVLAAVAVVLATAVFAEERPDLTSAPADANEPTMVSLASKGQQAAKLGGLDLPGGGGGLDLDREAWELALHTAAQASGEELVASEDGQAPPRSALASPDAQRAFSEESTPQAQRAFSEESAQQVRDRLAKLQVQLNKAMEEMNAKMMARQSRTQGETETAAAERQKQLEAAQAWRAHPAHKQKRREAVEATEKLKEVVARLQEKREKRLAAKEADAELSEESP